MDVFVRLFAPVLPFATEEVWSWTHDGSVHVAAWPTADEVSSEAPTGLLPLVSQALIGIRRAKTDAKVSQKTPVTHATLAAPMLLAEAAGDLKAVGRIDVLDIMEGESIEITAIELGEAPERA